MLNARQRAHLRSLAHELKPVVRIGKEGVTDAAVSATAEALSRRELLKVRVLEGAPDTPRNAAQTLAEGVPDVEIVQVIGRTAVLYRRHPERPKIALPQ